MFADASDWFSIRAPATWTAHDESNDFARMLRLTSPDGDVTLFVRLQLIDQPAHPDPSPGLLRAVIGMRFDGGKTLARGAVQTTANGDRTMPFSFERSVIGRTQRLRGDSIMRVHGAAFVSILAFSAPAAMFERLRDPMQTLMSALVVDVERLDPDKLTITKLRRYRHPGGLFEVNAPEAWHANDESTPGRALVKFFDLTGRAGMAVEIAIATPAAAPQSAKKLLLAQVAENYGRLDGFQLAPAREFGGNRADVTFSYQTDLRGAPVRMLGWCLLQRDRGVVATLRVLIPQSTVQHNWSSVIDIGAGFTVDGSAPLQ